MGLALGPRVGFGLGFGFRFGVGVGGAPERSHANVQKRHSRMKTSHLQQG